MDGGLRARLDALLKEFPFPERLPEDPVSLLRRYDDPEDLEVAGLVAATLALGRVSSIRTKAGRALEILGPRPARFVRSFEPRRHGGRFASWSHRWYRGRDLVALLTRIRRALERHGSLQRCFLGGYEEDSEDVGEALSIFVDEISSGGPRPRLLSTPRGGSACKRMNLYLRWMVRRDDGVDFGVWREVSPSKLIIPLDVHVARIAREIGWTRRRTPDIRMAREVTRSLRRLDPSDPMKYDFLLCHLGMMGQKKIPGPKTRKCTIHA